MLDLFGNPEGFSLFYDSRISDRIWYPTEYARHPLWGQYLTLQVTATLVLPASQGYTETIIIPGTPGTGSTVTSPGSTSYPGSAFYPGTTGGGQVATYPGAVYPGSAYPGSTGGDGTPDTVIIITHPATPYSQTVLSALPDTPRKRN